MVRISIFFTLTSCLVLHAPAVSAADTPPALDTATIATIDATAENWLTTTGAPSASIAVVQDGKVAYVKAYGSARLNPNLPATTETRYAIDSVSKEFTAAAVLILVQQGKLSLDDQAGKYLPDLGEASSVTLRQLLTHTAGLRDFWPQDFVPPEMSRPTTTQAIIREWAERPTDFPPGTGWQYSNTGFVVAGAIVEKVSGQNLITFLHDQIFAPLKMEGVTEDDTAPLSAPDAGAYTRYGFGPLHPAPKEGTGWLFAASNLAMKPSDLALWDISLIDRSLLAPDSYMAEFESIHLKNGTDKHYGLGLDIEEVDGHRRIGHDGAGSGFLAENRIWPDDRIAIVALTNNDWASPSDLVNRIARLLLPPRLDKAFIKAVDTGLRNLVDRIAFLVLPPTPEEARTKAVFAGFQNGMVDRTLFTEGGNYYLTADVLADLKASLGPLGPIGLISLEGQSKRGGMVNRRWKILCGKRRLEVVERGYAGGKLEQFMVSAAGD
jgi:D-alanyl-D-alanine carboxypeptidase